MKLLFTSCILFLSTITQVALASVTVGQPAANFSLTDTQGKQKSLSDYQGKWVVLEWFNHECPFVKKHYDSRNMQNLQKKYTEKGVAWLAINSTNNSHGDYKTPQVSNELNQKVGGAASAILLDPDGKVGKLYGAKTTPHMYIIDPKGTLVYAGGIDDKRSTNVEDVKTSKNYVSAALDEALAGKPISIATAVPYGCSVKY